MKRRDFFKAVAVAAAAPLAVLQAAPVPIKTTIGLKAMLLPWYKRPAIFEPADLRFIFADDRETLGIDLLAPPNIRRLSCPPGSQQVTLSVHELHLASKQETYELVSTDWEVIIEGQ